MKVSDYIVRFLQSRNVTDVFGYPGVGCGHLMDSLSRSVIKSRLVYHEQAAAFAACAYAQASHKVGIAYTTAGPGGTNLLTGVANAYCDSIPILFIVGDKDLASLRGNYNVRQMASQEIDITDMAAPVTKWSYQVTSKEEIRLVLEKAFFIALNGRPGPVLLDIPSDIQRAEINPDDLMPFTEPDRDNYSDALRLICSELECASKPLLLVGNGIKQAGLEDIVLHFAKDRNIPIVTTLVCFDLYPDEQIKLGYIGMDGDYAANKAANDCDLLITLGARLNFKQVLNKRDKFAPNAKILRIDCDPGELEYRLRDEITLCADLVYLVPAMCAQANRKFDNAWVNQCVESKVHSARGKALNSLASDAVSAICATVPENTAISVDTGSHRRWVMESFRFKKGQRLYQSAGLVSMGYALPAAIGLYYATNRPVMCFNGDGGMMMNLQELQFVDRERLPITIVVLNNHCLGDIMEFQKKIFSGNYYITTEETGYKSADFALLAKAFHINYIRVEKTEDLAGIDFVSQEPQLIEVLVPSNVL